MSRPSTRTALSATFIALAGASQTLTPVHAQPTAFSLDEKSKVSIVLPQSASLPEQTAARELDDYLTNITGGEFTVQNEPAKATGPAIYVGATEFARAAGIVAGKLAPEQWRIKAQNKALILAGGGTRGTLYATYHFLEDNAGVRWWTPWEESVPARRTLRVPLLNRTGKPVFSYRDVYMTYGVDEGRFAIRRRLNRDGDAPVGAQYGGSRNYGPPYHVHTFYKILSPEKYHAEHPDWFLTPGGGVPTMSNSQLHMSHPGMRQEFLRLLRENIRSSHEEAKEKGLPVPDIFSVSQEDTTVGFVGPNDAKLLAENDGAESAIMIDFVNFLADGIKDEFPDVYIDTLAYFTGEKAPKTIRPRDNVIIRLCDTPSSVLEPITAVRNKVLRENVEAWSKITKNLFIWDYNITFRHPAVPTPTLQTYGPDLRFFRDHNVQGMFVEFEYPLTADMRDLKVWVLSKLMEDPNQSTAALIKEFTDGYYGPAAPYVREVLALTEKAAKKSGADVLGGFVNLEAFTYLTRDFLQQADGIYDKAAAAVANDPVYAKRVRRARFSVDDAALKLFHLMMPKWVQAGHKPADFPLKRDKIAERNLQTQYEQIDLQLPPAGREYPRWLAHTELARWTSSATYTPVPPKFSQLPLADLSIYDVENMRNYENKAMIVKDAQAATGAASRLEIPEAEVEKYKMPFSWGIYDLLNRKNVSEGTIKPEDITGPGYHWYKMSETTLPHGDAYAYFSWSWLIQLDISDSFDKNKPDQKFEVWGSIKFEGPAFPHGKTEDKNAISVERLVLVKK
jgi:hypothetical protein